MHNADSPNHDHPDQGPPAGSGHGSDDASAWIGGGDGSGGGKGDESSSERRGSTSAELRAILDNVGGQLEKLTAIQREHEAQTLGLEERERRLAEAERALKQRQVELAEAQSMLEADRMNSRRSGECDSLEAERAQWAEERRTAEHALDERATALARREAELAERAERIEREREHVGAEGAAVEEARQTSATHAATLEAELGTLQDRLQQAETQVETRTCQLGELMREHEETRRLLEEKSHAITEYDQRIATMMKRCAELEASLTAGAERAEQLESAGLELAQDVETERDTALEELRAVRAEHEEVLRQVERATEARTELEAKVARLETELADARGPAATARTEIGADVRLQAMQLRVNKLEAQLAKARATPPDQASSKPAAPREDDEARLRDFRAKAERLAEVATHLRRRQNRLKTVRRLLRDRPAVPIKQVVDMEQHAAQMRHLGQQRHELAERRNKLVATERKMIRKWARSRSIVLTGWIVVMAVVAAGAAWLGVNHFKPAVVSASVVMEAQSKDRQPLTDEESELWQTWHAGLARDKSFHETLAQRFDERRLDVYAEKAAVTKRLQDLSIDPSQPGRLTFTLAGTDAGEIKQVLDVVVTSIVTESEANKRKRGDNAWATLPKPRVEGGREAYAAMNAVPIDDQRLVYAGPAFGVALVFLLLLSKFICGRLMDVKHELDADGTLFDPLPKEGGRAADGTVTAFQM